MIILPSNRTTRGPVRTATRSSAEPSRSQGKTTVCLRHLRWRLRWFRCKEPYPRKMWHRKSIRRFLRQLSHSSLEVGWKSLACVYPCSGRGRRRLKNFTAIVDLAAYRVGELHEKSPEMDVRSRMWLLLKVIELPDAQWGVVVLPACACRRRSDRTYCCRRGRSRHSHRWKNPAAISSSSSDQAGSAHHFPDVIEDIRIGELGPPSSLPRSRSASRYCKSMPSLPSSRPRIRQHCHGDRCLIGSKRYSNRLS